MKIIFLDIDGVLNCNQTLELARRSDVIDPKMVANLNKIIEATDAKVVISSTWRNLFTLDDLINQYLMPAGFKGEIIGITPDIQRHAHFFVPRGSEIQAWLNGQKDVESFVILDDDSDMEHLRKFLVQTSFIEDNGGLQEEHVNRAIKILNSFTSSK